LDLKSELVQISDIGKVITGKTPPTKNTEYFGTEIPFLTPSDIISESKYVHKTGRSLSKLGKELLSAIILPPNSISVSCIGSDMGKTVFIQENMITNQQFNSIVPNNLVDSEFLYYFFKSKRSFLKNLSAGGSAQPIVKKSLFEEIQFLLFPLEIQINAGKILSDLDSKIHNLQNQNKILEQMAQAIFQSWFVDFDGVTEFEDSELGQIPKGWSVEKISDVCETFGGGTPPTKNPNYWNGQNYWLAPSDLTSLNRVFCVDSKRKITDEGLQNCASKIHPENSILMTSRATIGVFCINKIPVATNQGFIVSKPNNPDHIYYIFLNYRNRVDEFLQNANGSTFLEISRSNFRQLPILIPTPEILDKFHVMAKLLFENIFVNEKMIEDLTNTRDALLPKLMSGEIRV
jgi:type I restriction enzyme, S subunit